jgi:nicotinic acid phosphoribosyltransferase
VRTADAQASFDALKRALSSAPVLRTFDPARRAVLTTDASNIAVAAILTQPDDDGRQHPVAYESRKLTAAERNYPAHVLELLAVVHSLRVFRHYLLGGGAPRPPGCWSDFDLRTDNQAITWLKTSRHLNKMYVRWLDEIEDFRFDVTHLPGTRNPTDPLSRRGFADGDGPAASTGDNADGRR